MQLKIYLQKILMVSSSVDVIEVDVFVVIIMTSFFFFSLLFNTSYFEISDEFLIWLSYTQGQAIDLLSRYMYIYVEVPAHKNILLQTDSLEVQ